MRKLIMVAAMLAALVGVVRAADAELDMDLMQTIEDTNKSLASNIALKNAKASTDDAQELVKLFGVVEAHFVAKGDAPDAVDLSRKSKTYAQDIIKAVGAQQFDAATDSATNISRACRSCHTFYKKS
jgi:ribosomal protein L9